MLINSFCTVCTNYSIPIQFIKKYKKVYKLTKKRKPLKLGYQVKNFKNALNPVQLHVD